MNNYNIWQVDTNQTIWEYGSVGWSQVPGSFASIAAGGDGEVWGITSSGQICRRVPLNQDGSVWMPAQPPATPDRLSWIPADPPPPAGRFAWQPIAGSLASVAVGSGQVWGIDNSHNVHRWNGRGWDQLPGNLVSIAVGDDGQVWGIDGDQKIYQWNGRAWNQFEGSFVSLAVASNGFLYAVKRNREIYRRDGSEWTQIPGRLSSIAAGCNKVWGLDNGLIYEVATTELVQIPGSSNSLSVPSAPVSGISLAAPPAPTPAVLGSGSNYILYSDCNPVRNLSVTIDVWEDIVGSPGVGFAFQLNAYSAAGANYYFQQYCMTVDGARQTPVIGCAICNWGINATYPLICQDYDLYPPYPPPQHPVLPLNGYVIQSGSQLKIILGNDSSGNIVAVTFRVVNRAGEELANRTISLLSLENDAFASVTSTDLAPIHAFTVNIVGPNNEKNTIFSSGSGMITCAAANLLTALKQAPACIFNFPGTPQGYGTAESSTCAYGNLPAIPSTSLAQAFICVNAPASWPVAAPT